MSKIRKNKNYPIEKIKEAMLLLSDHTVVEVSKMIGIPRYTIYTWAKTMGVSPKKKRHLVADLLNK